MASVAFCNSGDAHSVARFHSILSNFSVTALQLSHFLARREGKPSIRHGFSLCTGARSMWGNVSAILLKNGREWLAAEFLRVGVRNRARSWRIGGLNE